MSSKVKLVIPEAPAPAAVATATAQRQLKQAGIRLGILDNSKGNADHLLKFIIDGIKAEMQVDSVVTLRKDSVRLPAPQAILDKLQGEFARISRMPDMQQKAGEDTTLIASTPEQFRRLITAETERWRKLVKEANLKPD